MNAEDLVAGVWLFRGLSKKHLVQLARCTTMQQYAAGQVIVKQGDAGFGLYVIAAGAVEVRKERPGQESVVLNALGPGNFFGEMALLDDSPRSATVAAREPTQCLTIDKWHFLAELDSHPDMALPMLKEMAGRLRDTSEQSAALQ